MQPGKGLQIEGMQSAQAQQAPSLVDTFLNLVPQNPVEALATANILQFIVFMIVFGMAISLAGEKGRALERLMESIAEVMYKLTGMVMELAPYGVFALMAWVTGNYGLTVLLPLLKVIIGVFLACLMHAVLTYGGLLYFGGKLSPWHFFKGIIDAHAVAFSTTSSSGTLPVNLACTQDNLGVSKSISSFVRLLGATINMDGTVLCQGVATLFVAQAYGIDLSAGNFATIILTSTLASIGTAGVPGSGLIMLSMVLSSVGLPLEGVALVAGIDRTLDMARTTINITGDAMVSVLVAKNEKALDENVYNSAAKILYGTGKRQICESGQF